MEKVTIPNLWEELSLRSAVVVRKHKKQTTLMRVRETACSVMCLPHKDESMRSNLYHPCVSKPGVIIHQKLHFGETSLASQSNQRGKFGVSERCLSMRTYRRMQLKKTLYTCMRTHTLLVNMLLMVAIKQHG